MQAEIGELYSQTAIPVYTIDLEAAGRALKLDTLDTATTCAMCGRTRCTLASDQVVRAAGTSRWVNPDDYRPSYNASPGFSTPVVRMASEGPQIETMRCAGNLEGRNSPAKARRPLGRCLQYPPAAFTGASPSYCCCRWGLVPSFTKKEDKPDFFRMVSRQSAS